MPIIINRGIRAGSWQVNDCVKLSRSFFFIFIVSLKLTGKEIQLNGSVWMCDMSD